MATELPGMWGDVLVADTGATGTTNTSPPIWTKRTSPVASIVSKRGLPDLAHSVPSGQSGAHGASGSAAVEFEQNAKLKVPAFPNREVGGNDDVDFDVKASFPKQVGGSTKTKSCESVHSLSSTPPSPTFSETSSFSTPSASGTVPSLPADHLRDMGISSSPLYIGPGSALYMAGSSDEGISSCKDSSPKPERPDGVAVSPTALANAANPAVVGTPWKLARERSRFRDVRARQSRLLLAAVLENITSLYDPSRERGRRLFQLLCDRLTKLGLLQDEHIDEMSSLRVTYNRAFGELVSRTAWEANQQEYPSLPSRFLQPASRVRSEYSSERATTESASKGGDAFQNNLPFSFSLRPCRKPLRRLGTSPPFLLHTTGPRRMAHRLSQDAGDAQDCHSAIAVAGETGSAVPLFDLTESRYASDFHEIGYLGKGGYGNVVAARNRLDGAVYAIKKINVGQFGDNEDVNYEKLFREIKSLARLEHVNIVRYYCSWIEHAAIPPSPVNRRSSMRNSGRLQSLSDSESAKGDAPMIALDRRRRHLNAARRRLEKSSDGQGSHSENDDEEVARLAIGEPLGFSDCSKRRRSNDCPSTSSEGGLNGGCQRRSTALDQLAIASGGESRSPASLTTTMPLCGADDAPVADLVLFIQMQLYQASLRDWIRSRNRTVFRCIDRTKKHATSGSAAPSNQKCSCRALSPRRTSNFSADSMNTTETELSEDPLTHVSRFAAIDMFCGLASGVYYLHSRGHIHRDLKPANVFLERVDSTSSGLMPSSPAVAPYVMTEPVGDARMVKEGLLTQSRWIPKIGDFGLATTNSRTAGREGQTISPYNDRTRSDSYASRGVTSSRVHVERTKRVGTATYASPEMLSGREYDEKVDIWSLGIILFELLHPFSTDMERARTLDGLRSRREIPEAFRRRWPSETALILHLTAAEPVLRPTSKEIVHFCNTWRQANDSPELSSSALILSSSSRYASGSRSMTSSPRQRELFSAGAAPLRDFALGCDARRSPYTDLPLPPWPNAGCSVRSTPSPVIATAAPKSGCACHREEIAADDETAALRLKLQAKDAELAEAARVRESLELRVLELQNALATAKESSKQVPSANVV